MLKKVIFWGIIFKFGIVFNQELSTEQWEHFVDVIGNFDPREDQEYAELIALFPGLEDANTLTIIEEDTAPTTKKYKKQNTRKYCDICEKWVSKMSVHKRINMHNNEWKYVCAYCPKRFREACAKSKHERRHMNGRILKLKKPKKEKKKKTWKRKTLPGDNVFCLMDMVTKKLTK